MLTLEARELLRRMFIFAAIMHELHERGGRLSILDDDTILTLIRPHLDDLRDRGLVTRNGDYFVATAAAAQPMQAIAALYARLAALNIFENTAINMPPESLPLDGSPDNIIHPGCHDPRFPATESEREAYRTNGFELEDLRVWMCEFLGLSPHVVFFLNILRDRTVPKDERFWLNLRLDYQLNELDRRIENAYRWQEAWGSPEEGLSQARYWYEAGMREITKRNGRHCSACNVSLAMVEIDLAAQGKILEACPNPECGVIFSEPPQPQFQCPRCQNIMEGLLDQCPSCSLHFDHQLAAGTIEERVTTMNFPAHTPTMHESQYELMVVQRPVVYWSQSGCTDLAVTWGPVTFIL